MSAPKSPPSKSFKSVLQRHPVAAAIIAIAAFVVWTFPIGIAQAWPAFVRDKTIPEWLAERRWPGMNAQVYGWLTIIFFLALVILLVVIIIVSRRRGISPQSASTIDELGSENLSLKDTLDGTQRAAISHRLERDTFKDELDKLKTKYGRLHEIADAQAKAIDQYVRVERVLLCDLRLNDPIQIPYVEFWLDIINTSVYDITVDTDTIKGRIKFQRNDLFEGKQIIYLQESIPPSSRVNVNIKQRLNTTEVKLLTPYESKKDEALPFFNLSDLVITISGGTQFPQVGRKCLILPQDIGIKDSIHKDRVSMLEAEVSTLQSELDKLKKHKLKFEIDAPRSKVCVAFAYKEGYDVSLHLYIRFINSDTYPLFVHTVSASLIKKDEDETELEIPKIAYELHQAVYNPELESAWQLKSWENIDLKISERDTTLYHTIKGRIDVSRDNQIFNKIWFLRVSMEAMNQTPYSLDFEVDWDGRNQGWMSITPRT